MKSFEFFIAKRYLRSKRRTAFISTITYLSFFGIAIGVAVLVIVMSVFNGFENEVKTRFIANDAHLRIQAFSDHSFYYDSLLVKNLESGNRFGNISKVSKSPYIESFGMLKGQYSDGALVRGVDTKTIGTVSLVKDQLVAGSFDLEGLPDDYPGVVLGRGLADRLGVILGEDIRIISPAITSTLSQPPVKVFRVCGIFESGLAEIDAGTCYISLEKAQSLFRMPDQCNGVYIKLEDEKDSDFLKTYYNQILKYPLTCISWKDMHKNLFAWFAIEKLMMSTVLSLIVIIAAFNILSSLIMVVMEKRKDIGIMMAMGAHRVSIIKIFVMQGMLVGTVGTIFGLILGYIVCLLQLKLKIIKLPSDVYFIDSMPIMMHGIDFISVAAASLLITFLATIYPSMQAAKLLPADIIRND